MASNNFKDITGQKFNRWTVIERCGTDKYRNALWLCECDCKDKTRKIISGAALRSGTSKSCGCLRKEACSKALSNLNKITKKKYNQYDLTGEYGVGHTSKGEEFYFDLEDYEKIKDYCWHIRSDGYVATNIKSTTSNNFKGVKFHRLLYPDAEEIDHINHRKNDNRKYNLREVNRSTNMMNRSAPSNNKSGHCGVYYCEKYNKWDTYITVNKEQIYLGRHNTFEEAVTKRKEAEEKYFGEFSYENSMKKWRNSNGR